MAPSPVEVDMYYSALSVRDCLERGSVALATGLFSFRAIEMTGTPPERGSRISSPNPPHCPPPAKLRQSSHVDHRIARPVPSDRKRVVWGRRVSFRANLGGRRVINNKK